MTEREAILGRVREALRIPAPMPGSHGGRDPVSGQARQAARDARQWLPPVGPVPEDWLALFARNSADLKTDFHCAADQAAAHGYLRQTADDGGWKRIAAHGSGIAASAVVTLGLPVLSTDDGYRVDELEKCDAGITECDALVAQTGSVLLTSRSGGGRALSVLPAHHVVIARLSALVPDLPAAYELLHRTYGGSAGWPGMTTLITGPSRTGDIERILVLGAHGPKKLTVIVW